MSNPVADGKNNGGFNLLAALQHNALGDADRLDREADEAERAARAARHEAAFLRALHGAAMAYESVRAPGRVANPVLADPHAMKTPEGA